MEVYFVTDRTLWPDRSLPEIVREASAAGVKYVQLREKDLGTREMRVLAGELVEACRPGGARLLINDRLDIALAAGADGVHLPLDGLPVSTVRRVLGKRLLIGASTHSLEEAERAESAGADFLVFGPVFPSPDKLRYGPPLGIEPLRAVLEKVYIPVFAIGGIDTGNVGELRHLNLGGVAVIRALMTAKDIPATVRILRGGTGSLNRREPIRR